MSAQVRRVAILGHTGRPGVRKAAARLATRLRRRRIEVRFDEYLGPGSSEPGHALPKLGAWCQLLLSLGGDGTALRGARALAGKPGVLLPVNLGGLGFLTVAEELELDSAVDAVLAGAWPIARRRLVSATRRRTGTRPWRALGMNDAVIKTAGGYSAIHLRLETFGSDLGHLVADGLIAATAAGSTAYSLSAGGPVLAPDLEALVVTPVCPHTLGSRSLVLSPSDHVTVKVLGSHDPSLLILDGQDQAEILGGDVIEIALSRTAVRVVRNPGRPFGQALHDKLGWQGSAKRSMR